jgi:hypothetical protein
VLRSSILTRTSPNWVEPDDPSIIPRWAELAKTLVKLHCEKECCKKPIFSKAELSEVDEEQE